MYIELGSRRVVSVYEVMPYVSGGVLNNVLLRETHDGSLGAVVPEKGKGRYSIPNAIKRRLFFEAPGQDSSLQGRRQWNASHRGLRRF